MMGIGSEAFNCIACEDRPYAPNDPCAVCGKTSTVALPDELEVVTHAIILPADHIVFGPEPFETPKGQKSEPLVTLSQAHSTIAALRAEVERRKKWEDQAAQSASHWKIACFDTERKLETAEAEVKRLTEAGNSLSNVVFNLSQLSSPLTDEQKASMRQWVEAWDAATLNSREKAE